MLFEDTRFDLLQPHRETRELGGHRAKPVGAGSPKTSRQHHPAGHNTSHEAHRSSDFAVSNTATDAMVSSRIQIRDTRTSPRIIFVIDLD